MDAEKKSKQHVDANIIAEVFGITDRRVQQLCKKPEFENCKVGRGIYDFYKFAGAYAEYQRSIGQTEIRDGVDDAEKKTMYQRVIKEALEYFWIIGSCKTNDPTNDPKIREASEAFLKEVSANLLIFGSKNDIEAFIEFRRKMSQGEIAAFFDFISIMRSRLELELLAESHYNNLLFAIE
jgi:hypothetical protein